MTNSKRGMIPPYLLFCLFFVSRVVVTLTYVQGVSVGKFGSDILVSLALSFVILMLSSLPIYFCLKKGKSPLDSKIISAFYSLYFCFYASITVSRFAYFSASRLNTEISMVVVIILVSLAMCYGACLGIESIGRFGFVCAILLVLTLAPVLGLNIHNLILTNFYPIFNNSTADIIKNAVLFSSNSIAPAYALLLSQKVNGKMLKSYVGSLSISYIVMSLLVLFCIGTMGSAAELQSYPIYTLFQLASLGAFSRLDIFHTAFWILAVLLKSSLLIYCASISQKHFSHTKKCLFFSILTLILSIVFNQAVGTAMLTPSKIISIAFFGIFVLIIPSISLLIRRKNEKN